MKHKTINDDEYTWLNCREAFCAILKKEEVDHMRYIEYPLAKLAMFQFIAG